MAATQSQALGPSSTSPIPSPAASTSAPASPWTPEQLALHENAGPKVLIIVWTLLCLSSIFLYLRIYGKRLRGKSLWWDDYILICAWICVVGQASMTSWMVALGFGLHSWDVPAENWSRLILVSCVGGNIAITATIWTKTSFALTLLRLVEFSRLRIFLWFIIISLNVAMGLSALFTWTQCTPFQKVWDPSLDGTCWPLSVLVDYDVFSAVYSGIVDLTLALIPWKLLWKLPIRRKEKFGAAVAMSMGVFAGITSLVKAYKISMVVPDIYPSVELDIWGNVETNVTIMAASIPVLRFFLTSSKPRDVSSGGESWDKATTTV